MVLLVWFSNSNNRAKVYSILNLIICIFDAALFWFDGVSFSNGLAWFIFAVVCFRLAMSVLLYFAVKQRHILGCQGWCLSEVVMLILVCISIAAGFYLITVKFIILNVLFILVRIYGLWIIYTFLNELKGEIMGVQNSGTDNIPNYPKSQTPVNQHPVI